MGRRILHICLDMFWSVLVTLVVCVERHENDPVFLGILFATEVCFRRDIKPSYEFCIYVRWHVLARRLLVRDAPVESWLTSPATVA